MHDAHRADPSYAFALSRLDSADFRTPRSGSSARWSSASYDELMAEQIDAARAGAVPVTSPPCWPAATPGKSADAQPLTDDLPGQLEHGQIVVLGEVGVGGQHDAVQLEGQPARVLAGR